MQDNRPPATSTVAPFAAGELALLVDRNGKQYLVRQIALGHRPHGFDSLLPKVVRQSLQTLATLLAQLLLRLVDRFNGQRRTGTALEIG